MTAMHNRGRLMISDALLWSLPVYERLEDALKLGPLCHIRARARCPMMAATEFYVEGDAVPPVPVGALPLYELVVVPGEPFTRLRPVDDKAA